MSLEDFQNCLEFLKRNTLLNLECEELHPQNEVEITQE